MEATVALSPEVRAEFGDHPSVTFVETASKSGAFRRFVQEQTTLPGLFRRSRSQLLLSTGNFALWNSPVPQILLSRNSLYTSAAFYRDVRARGDHAIWADTLVKGWTARHSIQLADITVAPSAAFAQELTRWTGKRVVAVHHGFDPEAFTADSTPLQASVQQQIDEAKDSLRLLFVSHYNYYRNFETLFRALPILRDRLCGKNVKLFLTCQLSSSQNPGRYQAESASALRNTLPSGESIVELGTVPYRSLHHLYRACHIYVTPAYAESFAHPLVEAMSSGLPVLASDLPVHREICRDAALYFPCFSPDALAERVLEIHQSRGLAAKLSRSGLNRAQDFRWDKHVDQLIALARQLLVQARECP